MSFRIEKKIILNQKNTFKFKNWLKQNNIKIIYSDRQISSIYFDNKINQSFYESEEGVVPRKKIRLRYYGNNKDKILLEKKISSAEGRFKESKPFHGNLKNLRIFDKNYGICYPVIYIQYLRSYYIFKGLRITYDRNIKYKKIYSNFLVSNVFYEEKNNIIEIKNNNLNNINFIYQNMPFEYSRFSKYCEAKLKLNSLKK